MEREEYEIVPDKETNSHKMTKGHTRVQWAIAVLVNMTLFTGGLQSGWLSPMTKILQSSESPVGRPQTDSEISIIAGISALTAMAGIPILLYVVDTYGRKSALFAMSLFQLLCWLIKLLPASYTSLLIARVFSGLGAGGCFVVVPMYIKEISQDHIRGALGSISVLFLNLGILTMYTLGAYLGYYTVLYVVVGIPILTAAGIIFIAPESPPFLVSRGRVEKATSAIAFLRGLAVSDKQVHVEIDTIKKEDDYFKSIPNITFMNIFKEKAWRRGFIFMMMIIMIHGCNGSFAIVNYAATMLKDSNVMISPELQTLGIPIFMTIGTAFMMSTIDKFGRKLLLGVTFVITALTFLGLGSVLLLRDNGWSTPGWLTLVALLIVVGCYGGGVNAIPFIISSEMFNFQIRAKLISVLSFLAWFMNFVQLLSFTAITNSVGAYASFYCFFLLNITGAILVVLLLPETGGKTVEEIEAALRKEKIVRS